MAKYGNHFSDENSNIYENFVKDEQFNLQAETKPVPISKNDLTKLNLGEFKEYSDTDINNKNNNDGNLVQHEPIETIDKKQFIRKPIPAPKPSILKNISKNSDSVQDFNDDCVAGSVKNSFKNKIIKPNTEDQLNNHNANVQSMESYNQTTILNKFDMDFVTYSMPIKIKKQTTEIDGPNEMLNTLNTENKIPPKLVEINHNRSSSLNEKDIYSKCVDLKDVATTTKESSSNYYNLSKEIHNNLRNRKCNHLYESIDESMFKSPALSTSVSLDMQITDQLKKKFFSKSKTLRITDNKNQKQSMLNSDIYEEIRIPVYSRTIIIEKFIKADLDFINLLSIILSYQDKLVIHRKLHDIFKELFKIVLELKDCHLNIIEKFRKKMSILNLYETMIGDDLKEFALYDYKWNKEYIECFSKILLELKNCDIELEIFRYFSINKLHFKELLESLSRPLIQLQTTIAFFEALSKSSPQNLSDKHEINQVLAIGKDFVTEMPDLYFFSSMPVRCSYIIESVKNEKKASYLVLFSDVIACQRLYVNKKSKFSWIIPITRIAMHNFEKCEVSSNLRNKDLSELQILNAKLNLEEEQSHKSIINRKSDIQQKKLERLDTQILSQLSVLPLTLVDTSINTNHQILFSSEYDRIMWFHAINSCKHLRSNNLCQDYNDHRLSSHVPSKSVKTILSESSEVTSGNLSITIHSMERVYVVGDNLNVTSDYAELDHSCNDLHVDIEIDYYGYFLKFATTKKTSNYTWDESFNFDIDCASSILLIVYKSDSDEPFELPIGQALIEFVSFRTNMKDCMEVKLTNGYVLKISIKFTPKKFMTRRIEPIIPGSIFGVQLSEIKDVNENGVPNFVVLCVTEIEARGLEEPGLYRISGLSKKIQKIRLHFDTNQYAQATALIKSEDIHGVASLLKLYFHTLPESLFSDKCYQSFVYGFTKLDSKQRHLYLLDEFLKLPKENQATANYIIDHLVKVDEHNKVNLMPMSNLATIWGPTLLRPALGLNFNESNVDKLASEATDMSLQTNIFLFFLNEAKNSKKILRV